MLRACIQGDGSLPWETTAKQEQAGQQALPPNEQKGILQNLIGDFSGLVGDVAGAIGTGVSAVAVSDTFESVGNFAGHGRWETNSQMQSRQMSEFDSMVADLTGNFATDKRAVTNDKLAAVMAMATELGLDASSIEAQIRSQQGAVDAEWANRAQASQDAFAQQGSQIVMTAEQAQEIARAGNASGVNGRTSTVISATEAQEVARAGNAAGVNGRTDDPFTNCFFAPPPSIFDMGLTGWARNEMGVTNPGTAKYSMLSTIGFVDGALHWSNANKIDQGNHPYDRAAAIGSRSAIGTSPIWGYGLGKLGFAAAQTPIGQFAVGVAKAKAGFAAVNGLVNAGINTAATAMFSNESTTGLQYLTAAVVGFGSGFTSTYTNLMPNKNIWNYGVGFVASAGTDVLNGKQIDWMKASVTGGLNAVSQVVSGTYFKGFSSTYTETAKTLYSDLLSNVSFVYPTTITVEGVCNFGSSTMNKDNNSAIERLKKKLNTQ